MKLAGNAAAHTRNSLLLAGPLIARAFAHMPTAFDHYEIKKT